MNTHDRDWRALLGRILAAILAEEGTIHDLAWSYYGISDDEREAALAAIADHRAEVGE
jgi:hypothetical protein